MQQSYYYNDLFLLFYAPENSFQKVLFDGWKLPSFIQFFYMMSVGKTVSNLQIMSKFLLEINILQCIFFFFFSFTKDTFLYILFSSFMTAMPECINFATISHN